MARGSAGKKLRHGDFLLTDTHTHTEREVSDRYYTSTVVY